VFDILRNIWSRLRPPRCPAEESGAANDTDSHETHPSPGSSQRPRLFWVTLEPDDSPMPTSEQVQPNETEVSTPSGQPELPLTPSRSIPASPANNRPHVPPIFTTSEASAPDDSPSAAPPPPLAQNSGSGPSPQAGEMPESSPVLLPMSLADAAGVPPDQPARKPRQADGQTSPENKLRVRRTPLPLDNRSPE
jgi:hypothetical protein